MNGDIKEVRDALFAELRQLRGDKPNLERAKAIRETCKVLLDSAKVEVDYLNVTGATTGSGFIPQLPAKTTEAGDPANGIVSVTRHMLQG